MWLEIWIVLVAFATLSTGTWAVLEKRVPMMTAISAFSWGLLAFSTGSLTKHEGGEVYTTSVPELQYFATFMTILSIVGLFLWHFGDFPPQEGELRQTTTNEQ